MMCRNLIVNLFSNVNDNDSKHCATRLHHVCDGVANCTAAMVSDPGVLANFAGSAGGISNAIPFAAGGGGNRQHGGLGAVLKAVADCEKSSGYTIPREDIADIMKQLSKINITPEA